MSSYFVQFVKLLRARRIAQMHLSSFLFAFLFIYIDKRNWLKPSPMIPCENAQ